MEVENRAITITAESLFKVLVKRIWILVIVGMLSFGMMLLYTNLTFVPQYESTGRIFILRQRGEDSIQNADYQVSLLIAGDCEHILKDHVVLDQIKTDLSYEELNRRITIENPEETRIVYVTVRSNDPKEAKRIADEICQTGVAVINNLMTEEQAKFYGEGKVPEDPCNTPSTLMMLLISFAIVVLVYIVFLILFIKNEHVGSGDDIESRLGVVVLGDIPNANRRRKEVAYASSRQKKGNVKHTQAVDDFYKTPNTKE